MGISERLFLQGYGVRFNQTPDGIMPSHDVAVSGICRLFGSEIPKFILFGQALLIGLVYGGTIESIACALDYYALRCAGLVVVVLTEFLLIQLPPIAA